MSALEVSVDVRWKRAIDKDAVSDYFEILEEGKEGREPLFAVNQGDDGMVTLMIGGSTVQVTPLQLAQIAQGLSQTLLMLRDMRPRNEDTATQR